MKLKQFQESKIFCKAAELEMTVDSLHEQAFHIIHSQRYMHKRCMNMHYCRMRHRLILISSLSLL